MYLILALFTFTFSAFALELKDQSLEFTVPYTFGSHTFKGHKLNGEVSWDEQNQKITQAQYSLKVSEIEVKDQKLKCHFEESMTLDYGKSDFPAEHVCVDNKLPQEGKNSSIYPEIKMKLLSPVGFESKFAQVEWEIRGMKKTQEIPIELKRGESGELVINTEWSMKRSDFGIEVKKFLFIAADDKIHLKLKMIWSN
ncbi:MAG: hypothetical protein K2P81_10215 [Bacteriovoracaceae bacterium]|nr:hypothetical protein [Bacteriovoracaceae bacterium]